LEDELKAVSFALAMCLSSLSPARAEIVIGVAGPMSGQYQSFGTQMLNGTKAAVDAINATGGINGESLAIISADDQCDNRKAVEAAQVLINQKVDVVIGHYCTYPSLAAAKLYAKAGISMIAPAASLPALTSAGLSNIIRLAPRDDLQGAFAARRILQKRPDTKGAVLDDGLAPNRMIGAQFVAGYGKQPDIMASIQTDAKDFSDILNQLKAKDISTLFLAMSASDAGHIIAQSKTLGLSLKFYGSDALLADQFWEASGSAGENTMVSFANDPQHETASHSVVAALKVAGQNADGATLPAYAAVELFAAAAKAKGAHSGLAIAAWLRQGQTIETAIGPFSFDQKGDAKDLRFTWFAWHEGKYEAIVPQN
jgi:branched-chain amino acid transport system substrate-binding protein